MTFSSYEDLKNYLLSDKELASLNPIRFINVESMQMWIQVKKLLQSLSDEMITLSKYCKESDRTPNIRRLSTDLNKVTKSVCVVPLSELLRVNPEQAKETVSKFLNGKYESAFGVEGGTKVRIYFLMYRMKSVMSVVPNSDIRKKDAFIYLDTDEESDYKLTIIQDDIKVNLPGNSIVGFKKYLEYWEQNPDKPLILHTSNAIYFDKKHFFDDVHVIVSSYDLIKDQYDLPNNITENLGSNIQWAFLAERIYNLGSVNEAFNDILHTNRYSKSLFERWSSLNEREKWVLWLYTRLQNGKSYIVECARNSTSSKQFIKEIYCNIINYVGKNGFTEVYRERKDILTNLKINPPESFFNKLDEIDSPISRLKCLTCSSVSEKKRIFEEIRNQPFDLFSEFVDVLSIVYPKLSAYLMNINDINSSDLSEEHYEYFKQYKWCKVTNNLSAEFNDKVKDLAYQKGSSVFSLYSRNSYISDNYDDSSAIFFADALGVEYVDYLAYLLLGTDKNDYRINYFSGICNLPSTTENNKDFTLNRNTITPFYRALDEHKHSNCQYPDNIIKELDIVEDLKNQIMASFSAGIKKVILAADHGTSRMAVLIRDTGFDNALPKPEDAKIYEYGRLADGTLSEEDYPTAISYNNKLIFADYSRFIQSGAPIDEMHGGASLEEWIVPIIIIEKISPNDRGKCSVILISNEHKVNPLTQEVTVKFKVDGRKCKNVVASINGVRHTCMLVDDIYTFNFIPIKGQTSAKVKIIDGIIIGNLEIQIKLGMSSNSKFDL